MATSYEILAHVLPSAATSTTLFTVAASTQVTVSTITVCNQSAVPTSFRLSVAVAGAVLDTTQYLYFDVPIPGNDTFVLTLGLTLNATDVVRCYATLATLSFNAFGVKIT